MNSFQLDENCNDRRLIRVCRAERACEVRQFPEELKGKKDWEWFPVLLTGDAPIITIDFTIATELQNVRAIPASSCGIIVIKPSRPEAFGSRRAMPILANFKVRFPPWAEISWSDIYAEITDVDVNIRKLASAFQFEGETIQLADADLVAKVQESIAAARG